MIQTLTIEAFATTSETMVQLQSSSSDRRLGKNRMTVMNGGLDAAITHYATNTTPKVIIIEDDQLEQLDQLADVCDPGTRVIIIGEINDITFYRSLMMRGVAEYLLRPLANGQIIETLERLFAEPGAAPKGRVVSFWGARGGTGSSCLAQNIAWLLGQSLKENIVYIDCDVSFGTSQLALGLDARQSIADVVSNVERLDTVLVDRSLVNCGDYLRVLASPGDLRLREPMSSDALDVLIGIASRMAPVVVLDLPHQWTDWSAHLMSLSSDVIVTACPDFASLRNTKALMEQVEAPLKLVLNGMDAYKRTQLSPKDFENTLSLKPVLSIPFEPVLFGEAVNKAQLAAQSAPSHKTVKLLAGLADQVSGKTVRKSSSKLALNVLKWVRA